MEKEGEKEFEYNLERDREETGMRMGVETDHLIECLKENKTWTEALMFPHHPSACLQPYLHPYIAHIARL